MDLLINLIYFEKKNIFTNYNCIQNLTMTLIKLSPSNPKSENLSLACNQI